MTDAISTEQMYKGDDVATVEDDEDSDGDERSTRITWEVFTWIIVCLTLLLNAIIVGILVKKKNYRSTIIRVIFMMAVLDILYGVFVTPFFVENYIHVQWRQSYAYCKIYTYLFTLHDLAISFLLLLVNFHVSLNFAELLENFNQKRCLYTALSVIGSILCLVTAIPSSYFADIIKSTDVNGSECRTWDSFTMIATYCFSSSMLFCFTMSFLFSLCIVGSPLLGTSRTIAQYRQRWRSLLTISLINIFYIICGFFLNYKELTRLLLNCCEIEALFMGINTVIYEVWSFSFYAAEPLSRPILLLCFYLRYLKCFSDQELH